MNLLNESVSNFTSKYNLVGINAGTQSCAEYCKGVVDNVMSWHNNLPSYFFVYALVLFLAQFMNTRLCHKIVRYDSWSESARKNYDEWSMAVTRGMAVLILILAIMLVFGTGFKAVVQSG